MVWTMGCAAQGECGGALVAQWHRWPMVWHRREAAGGEQVRRHCGGCRIAEVEGPAMRKEEEVGDKKKEEES